jgi:hypothetical protein
MSSPFEPGANPYRSPESPSLGAREELVNLRVPERIVELMVATRPWVRLMGVLSILACGLMVLAAVFVLLGGVALEPRAAIAVVYLVMSVLFYLVPGIYLFRYASRISDLVVSGGMGDLEGALAAQKTFWKYVGMLVLIVIVLYAIMVVVAIAVGVAGLL